MGKANNIKKEQAQDLFVNGKMDQNDIADLLDVTEATLSKWANAGKWEELRAAKTVTKDNIILNAYMNISDIQKLAREEGRPLCNAETDQILKLSKLIENLDKKLTISVYMQVFKDFDTFLIKLDPEFTKKLNTYQMDFINIQIGTDE